jgi:hypothetical protein
MPSGEIEMKKLMVLCVAALGAVPLAACNTTDPGDRAVGGAVLGGAAGALIGGAATGRPGGALVGGLVGATTGAVVGASTAAPPRCVEMGYDYYGNPRCIRYN